MIETHSTSASLYLQQDTFDGYQNFVWRLFHDVDDKKFGWMFVSSTHPVQGGHMVLPANWDMI